jgi:prepilin-type processing-associated H-X9-DG protein
MNCYLAPITPWNDGGNPYRDFFKDTDLVHPGPSTTYVLIDECAASINDAFIVIDPGQQNPGQPYWQDTPASRHGNAGGLSFADGHSEIRSYKDKQLLAANALVSGVKNPLGLGDPSSGDAAWICARATSLMH